jgi:transcriptional regulator with XRE-family HTH domain
LINGLWPLGPLLAAFSVAVRSASLVIMEPGPVPESHDPTQFILWLNNSMESRRLSQAELARAVGVGDAQVSRWRRGQVVPTVHSLQRLADTFGVPRAMLDSLAGYPSSEVVEDTSGDADDLARRAEVMAYQAWFGEQLERQVPRELWRVYADGCAALAEALGGSFRATLHNAEAITPMPIGAEHDDDIPKRGFGFRP